MTTDSDGIIDQNTGLPRLMSRRCDTCIFRPDDPMRLRPGRRDEMTAEAVHNGSWVVCHDSLQHGQHPEFGNAICRGFWNDPIGQTSGGVQIAKRFAERLTGSDRYPAEVDPPTE